MIKVFDDLDVEIYLKNDNAILHEGVYYTFSNQECVFRIVILAFSGTYLTINGNTIYLFGRDSVDVNVSDFIQENVSGNVVFSIPAGSTYNYPFVSVPGILPNYEDFLITDIFVDKFPFSYSFSIPAGSTSYLNYYDEVLETWVNVEGDISTTLGTFSATATKKKFRYYNGSTDELVYFEMKLDECTQNKMRLRWLSEYGTYKEWMFDVEAVENAYDRTISLQKDTNDYTVLKNKLKNYALIEPKADIRLQIYLSDIIFSDDVAILEGISNDRTEVNVSNTAYSFNPNSTKRQDFRITINAKRYDTI